MGFYIWWKGHEISWLSGNSKNVRCDDILLKTLMYMKTLKKYFFILVIKYSNTILKKKDWKEDIFYSLITFLLTWHNVYCHKINDMRFLSAIKRNKRIYLLKMT